VAETVGSLVDKICIVELKLYHMQEQVDRPDVTDDFRAQCEGRLEVLRRQRDDLVEEVTELVAALASGRVVPKIYRQFKMYNDPKYRSS